jgi:hypothetical protein
MLTITRIIMLRIAAVTLLLLVGCSTNYSVPKSCINVKTCISLVKLKLQSNLIFDESFKEKEVLIEFFLDDKGAVVQHNIISSSGLIDFDKAAKEAVYKSSPFYEIISLSREDFEEFKHIKLTLKPKNE